ncbi:hypothetical protein OEG84_25020 [Hoeflea sp. G2-23]|uniref:Phage tail protein n=1 Tax=Hoeflea algicola TaxID=2983763 RepID=A0ABT3Z345_9HYPH|nr:hypothetical protein [Hoeflea algicola]MCY0146146.1 hypothetical protein [Hoeflea algicola]MCY0150870.1 hypothetical protein [Hoeflea algicola]
MNDRVMFGNNGSKFVARVSKPGKDVASTDLADFSLHEDFSTLIPIARGTTTLATGASTSFTLSSIIGKHPFVVMKSSDGILPVAPYLNFYRGTYYLRVIPTTGVCTLYNEYATSLTITYAIFISP